MRPFETYPEDRQLLLRLANSVLAHLDPLEEDDAIQLADLVKSIVEDEEHAMILLEDEIEQTSKEMAMWAVDAIATATQDRRVLKGDEEEDEGLTEAIVLNTQKAIYRAMRKTLAASEETMKRRRQFVNDTLNRMEQAAMAYERLGKLTRDDEKTRKLRKEVTIELTAARQCIARGMLGSF